MTISHEGNVAIGTTNAQGYKLAVNGDAVFTKVKVKALANWPDFVFEENYKLPSLQELEAYIQAHKHLPGMPSATEVELGGGRYADFTGSKVIGNELQRQRKCQL
jgi:hypothetical protein